MDFIKELFLALLKAPLKVLFFFSFMNILKITFTNVIIIDLLLFYNKISKYKIFLYNI
jgi:hypothetical protein